ncbi:peptide deformylase [Aminobacter sp. NyZ550]|uniref:peptide deformylase n=1 Tax=Aminobacter sp. NyZ550 TaxID=2979870 RepID=UPI0021D5BE03|nr:peptide deformylase [Aminobacter sp. NyZ550]WAX94774.1 peptide deformylase [Aminobacter sp. NyZ550]
MPIRTIVKFPDPRLKLVAEPVTAFGDELRALAADLLDTMRAAPGIGITAPHIGIARRVVVLELEGPESARTYVNPRILSASEETMLHTEGSVSMPGVTDEIRRHARVRIGYQDLQGNERTEEAEGLLAVCHQHEIDQLDGMFWIQRLSKLKRDRLVKRYDKLQRAT